MTNAITLSDRIKYITNEDDEGTVGVLVLLGESALDTIVHEVTSKRDFERVYKQFRNAEVLDALAR